MTFTVHHDDGLPGAENMQRDLDLLHEVASGRHHAAMRTYTWSPWCVSLGKHQRRSSIDDARCRTHGFDVVYRPTGGRAVLHADELTYCIVVALRNGLTAQTVYERVHHALRNALAALVPSLSFTSAPTDLRHHYATQGAMAVSCFTSAARTEIMVEGRKVVGSAQRVIDGVLLQHGSILCGPGHEQLADVIVGDEDVRTAVRNGILEQSITLSEAAGRTVDANECRQCILSTIDADLPSIVLV